MIEKERTTQMRWGNGHLEITRAIRYLGTER